VKEIVETAEWFSKLGDNQSSAMDVALVSTAIRSATSAAERAFPRLLRNGPMDGYTRSYHDAEWRGGGICLLPRRLVGLPELCEVNIREKQVALCAPPLTSHIPGAL
jgi:hypothetical protein